MFTYNKLLVSFKCNNCDAGCYFEEKLDIYGIRQEECKDFDIKFIKNVESNEIEYSFSLRCNNCKTYRIITLVYIKNDFKKENLDEEHQCDKCKKKILIKVKLLSDNKKEKEKSNKDIPKDINRKKMNFNMDENNNIRLNNNNFKNINK